ncbi:serine-aspartate repeat-containing protein C [Monomorium pharaonis]|uniref:serine-aspartate repeat-containing protein C n=1 Tax=Monomorium pharaonis TaxID=307658 RepID=UPI00063F36A9|nr:serine-aspartate repeat-containing protein C [Monomorium pharaonis]
MAAILRVKRKTADSPQESLVIACKRQKTECSDSTPNTQLVAEFAGTLTDPTKDVVECIADLLPKVESREAGVKRAFNDNYAECIPKKLSKSTETNLAERYKVIQWSSLNEEKNYTLEDKYMTLIDVEDCWSTNALYLTDKEDIEDYEYDLYYAKTNDDDIVWLKNENLWVMQPECPNVESEDDADSEDSNAESHWKNDYPDTDPDNSSDHDSDSDNFDNFDNFEDNDDSDSEIDSDTCRRGRRGHLFPDDELCYTYKTTSSDRLSSSDEDFKNDPEISHDEEVSNDEEISSDEV